MSAATAQQGGPGAAVKVATRRKSKMLINVVLAVVALFAVIVVVLVIVVAMQPSDLSVARTLTMSASPAEAFAQVNDFRKWQAWSPYDKRDPTMQRTYEGPPAGVGASYAWNGNGEVGEGRSTIVEVRENELIQIKLEFKRPFAGINTAEFTFEPQGGQTAVTWSLIGKKNFMSKAVGLVMNMDNMIGGDFEQGLANIKAIVEAR